ncbi:hypothetical protein [Formosa algae]|uniref:hypothetical protein n=1 Tax=Formosa algae TaxID=225843 RepID=UPI000CCFA29F|nr:hypothetical protein [Formosa algae]PNW27128.1 hypothetical protein BKP44_14395 [Formosa algae]
MSKKITGKYSVPIIFAYEYYIFQENGVFDYHSGADLGDSEFSKGHYTIKNDSLILNYDLAELKEESYFKAKKYYNYKDSIQVKLNIYDFNKQPLYNVTVCCPYPKFKCNESNENGIVILKFKKEKRKDKLEILIDGEFLAKQIIYLDFDSNYNINVFMNKSVIQGFGHPKAIKDQIKKYKIIKISKAEIKLKTKNNKIITWVKQKE